MRRKKCPVCASNFTPDRPLQKVCKNYQCMIEHGRTLDAKRKRKRLKAGREGLKSKKVWLNEAEDACRRLIRARDRLYYAKLGQPPTCISCGTQKPGVQFAAGHHKTAGGHPELRFDEKNIYLQCNRYCNKELSGNINGTKTTHGYIKGLAIRFGQEKADEILDYLNSYHEPLNLTVDDIKAMQKDFNYRANEAEKELRGME